VIRTVHGHCIPSSYPMSRTLTNAPDHNLPSPPPPIHALCAPTLARCAGRVDPRVHVDLCASGDCPELTSTVERVLRSDARAVPGDQQGVRSPMEAKDRTSHYPSAIAWRFG